MSTIHITPARGRDYKSRMALVRDLVADKDFTVADMSSQWNGKPCNLSDLRAAGVTLVTARYNELRKVTTIDISKNIE